MKVEFHNETEIDSKEFEDVVVKVFDPIENESNVHVIFVSSGEIKRLNSFFRGIDRPTDVLSFINDDQEEHSLGDIFICLEVAQKQALELGHSIEREVAFLAVHGYLHLIGYDHQTKNDEEQMTLKQEEILNNAGIKR